VRTTNVFDALRDLARSEALPPESLVDLATTNPDGTRLWHALELGDIGQAEFEHDMAMLLGVQPEGSLRRLADLLRPDQRMLDLVAELRGRGVRTAVLSNSWGRGYIDPYAPWQLDTRVDIVILSDQVRMRKPEPGIIQLTISKLGVPATECVFVDDIAAHLDTPAALGVTTIHHTDPDTTIARLTDLFTTPVKPVDR